MKKFFFAIPVLCLIANLGNSQAIYSTDFGTAGGALPTGWSRTNTSLVVVNATSASSGYPGPPPASGSQNMAFHQSATGHNNVMVTVTVNPNISTVGKADIRVGFGNRKTASFNRVVTFDYSIDDGASWSAISTDISSDFGSNTTWGFDFIDLPADAGGVANLRFRFQYTSENNNNNNASTLRIDDFAVGENNSLPISLLAFTSVVHGHEILLSFASATEIDNSHFSIQRSANGSDFSEIGEVKGAGTSYEPQEYTFTDERPLPGKNYYRLKQVDFDGKYSFSPVVTATFGKTRQMTLAPLPATETLNIQLENPTKDDGIWQVYDMNGRLLLSGEMLAESNEQSINIDGLPEGAYVLRLTAGQEVMVEQFRKN